MAIRLVVPASQAERQMAGLRWILCSPIILPYLIVWMDYLDTKQQIIIADSFGATLVLLLLFYMYYLPNKKWKISLLIALFVGPVFLVLVDWFFGFF